jgi:hypothetical protein
VQRGRPFLFRTLCPFGGPEHAAGS